MSISLISFVIALVVLSGIVAMLLKQKSKPIRKQYKSKNSADTPEPNPQVFNIGLVQSKWAEIDVMQRSGPSGLKSALIDADKLLDYCMIANGFTGETMGDRLKSGGHQFGNINAVWSAHKLRNELAHNVEHDLVPAQITNAIAELGKAINDLGVRL